MCLCIRVPVFCIRASACPLWWVAFYSCRQRSLNTYGPPTPPPTPPQRTRALIQGHPLLQPQPHTTPPPLPPGVYDPVHQGQLVTLGSMFYFPTVPATGFVMYSTVFADDPTRFVLVAASIMDEYFDTVFNKSSQVVVVRCARRVVRAGGGPAPLGVLSEPLRRTPLLAGNSSPCLIPGMYRAGRH